MTGKKKTLILIVDDNPRSLQFLGNLLLENGYEPAAALNGENALKFVQKTTPDLILLDVMMPGTDGYEVCEKLKSDDATKDIPIIFLTAKITEEDVIRGFDAGGVDYVAKPFHSAELLSRVRTHVCLRKMQKKIEEQNRELVKAARLREDVERITRHDLKNPLNAVIASAGLLIETDFNREKRIKYLEMIRDAGYRILNMANLSLDMFKMERGVYPFIPVKVNISQTIRKVISETRSIAEQKRLSIHVVKDECAKPENTDCILGEDLLCHSMLANLVKNAVEASPEKERITITITRKHGFCVIGVHNRGAVPEEIRERFFEKYATSGKSGGTGLGTYSAKLIAETHGGSIGFESSEENGTTVSVRLPLRS